MKNFVIQYKFDNSEAKQLFKKGAESNFDRFRKENTEEYTYYLVWERHIAAVDDQVNRIMDRFQREDVLSEGDFVAVYFIDDFEPDQIKRQMLFGKDEYVENDIKKSYMPQHESMINDLLSLDFVKNQA